MGKVYSPDEIGRGRYPDDGAHYRLARELLALRSEITHAKFPIIGAMVHGSTARLEATVRSDVDFLAIVPDDISPNEFHDYVCSLHGAAWEKRLTVEPIVMTESQAKAGEHTIDTLFLDYLASAERDGGPFIEKPDELESITGLVTPCELDPLESLRQYIIHKKEKFTKSSEDNENYRDMQRALELPRAFGRRFLQALDITVPQLPNSFVAHLELLSSLDAEYSQLMEDIRTGKRDLRYYTDALGEMHFEALEGALLASVEALAAFHELTGK